MIDIDSSIVHRHWWQQFHPWYKYLYSQYPPVLCTMDYHSLRWCAYDGDDGDEDSGNAHILVPLAMYIRPHIVKFRSDATFASVSHQMDCHVSIESIITIPMDDDDGDHCCCGGGLSYDLYHHRYIVVWSHQRVQSVHPMV